MQLTWKPPYPKFSRGVRLKGPLPVRPDGRKRLFHTLGMRSQSATSCQEELCPSSRSQQWKHISPTNKEQ